MLKNNQLVSFHIVERENERNLLIWTYPTIVAEHKQFLEQKCCMFPSDYFVLKKNNIWFYFEHFLDGDRKFAVVVAAKDFEPNKYKSVCDILVKKYAKSSNPVDLVKLFLNLFCSGSCSLQENGFLCDLKSFEPLANLKDLIQLFGLEVILIYNAILLKRRLLVYNDNIGELQKELVAVINLVPFRDYKNYLYPLVDNVKELKGLSFYVAGTNNFELIKNESLYDVFVNLKTRDITISAQAEGIMSMTKVHKELATLLVKHAASDLQETEIIKEITEKTVEILDTLRSLATTETENTKMLTINELKSRKFQPNLENFLFNLALAENMMIL